MIGELSTKEDIDEVRLFYQDFATLPSLQDSVALENQQPSLSFKFGKSAADADLGVECEYSMSSTDLAHNLGFPNGTPVLFNQFRHRGGLTPWDPEHAPLFADPNAQRNPDLSRFNPHWHQLAGVHAIIRRVFSSKQDCDESCTGMLVADDVGLGKTCQAILVIAFLADAVYRQEENLSLPPLLSKSLLSLRLFSLLLRFK